MADVVIFPEQTVQFEATEQPGAVYRVIAPSPFVLVLGETYRVMLDGIAHVSTCVEFEGVPCIANVDDLYAEEMPPDGTFVIQYCPAGLIEPEADAAIVMVVDSSNAPTHTLAIYQTAAVSNDVITENWDGSTEVHPGVESVSLRTENGGEKKFVLEDLVAETVEKTVELDFSGGDMIVAPKKGQVFSSILIPKPDNLIPDNIAADKDVAGIIGALVTGRGNGPVVFWSESIYVSSGKKTITHNMGVVPDIVIAIINKGVYDNGKVVFGIGTTAAARNAGFQLPENFLLQCGTDGKTFHYTRLNDIDKPSSYMGFHSATETTISCYLSDSTYTFYLLGGLA